MSYKNKELIKLRDAKEITGMNSQDIFTEALTSILEVHEGDMNEKQLEQAFISYINENDKLYSYVAGRPTDEIADSLCSHIEYRPQPTMESFVFNLFLDDLNWVASVQHSLDEENN